MSACFNFPRSADPTAPLKELGVYELPDGREFVSSLIYAERPSLFSPRSWGPFGKAVFHIAEDGWLVSKEGPTSWRISDLRFTGRTIQYPRATLL